MACIGIIFLAASIPKAYAEPSLTAQEMEMFSRNVSGAEACGFITIGQEVDATMMVVKYAAGNIILIEPFRKAFETGVSGGKAMALEPGYCSNFPQFVLNAIRGLATAWTGGQP